MTAPTVTASRTAWIRATLSIRIAPVCRSEETRPHRSHGMCARTENGHRLYPSLDTTCRSQSLEMLVRGNTTVEWTKWTYSAGSAISAVPILRKPSRA